jgi:hypothetical protein
MLGGGDQTDAWGWRAMSNEHPAGGEPEPIEAEFEPAEGKRPNHAPGFAPKRLRSRSVTLVELLAGSSAAAIAGAMVAIIVTNASSTAGTGTLASEINSLARAQEGLSTRAGQMSADVVELRARLNAQSERLDRQAAGELSLRGEIAAVTSQVSALSGAEAGETVPGAVANNSPLGVLLARIGTLERIVEQDASAPQTTRQMQRALSALESQVAGLEEANLRLSTALEQRQVALNALANGVETLSGEVRVLREQAVASQRFGMNMGVLRRPTLDLDANPAANAEAAAADAKAIRALASLEAVARKGVAFTPQQQELAALLPRDADVAALGGIAPRGAPTLEQLRRDFDAAAQTARRLLAESGDDGWNWLRASVPVTSKRVDGAAEAGATLIREAKLSLDAGDVSASIRAIDDLPPRAAAAFTAWRDKALRLADLEQRLADLNRRLVGPSATKG